MKQILILLLLIITALPSVAQRGGTEDKKAERYYMDGREAIRDGRYTIAEVYFQKAIERDPNFLHPKLDLAGIYMLDGDMDKAKPLLEQIVTIDPKYTPQLILDLAALEMSDNNYEKAKGYYEQFMKMAPPESSLYYRAQVGAAKCEFAIHAMANPVEFNPINLGENINSELDEYFPAMTADESLLIYTRRLIDQRTPSGYNEDFYLSQAEAGEWEESYNPGAPVNSGYNEGAPTLSPDGKYIIFTACEIYGEYGQGKRGYGSCDLFISERQGDRWGKPHNMGVTINSKGWETQPSFASDGRTLYFIRGKSRPDEYGNHKADIYTSTLVNGRWSAATRLPSNVNSPEDEESVFIHPDNQTLYFSSEGHLGMGMMDIFVSRKQEDGTWGDPVNLGYPINTGGSENSFHVSASGNYGLIASDREGGLGGLDLYSFELPEHARPNRVTYLKGTITDAKTNRALEARFELIDLATGDTVVRSYSDERDGQFLVVLPDGKDYALIADKAGYLYHSENFELRLDEDQTHYQKNIQLQPIEAGRSVVLKNVFFDTDKFDLKPTSKTELNKLTKLMEDNETIKIEISGHTDNQGNADANQVLSQNRAKAVYDYLVGAGISSDRLSYKGYGQTAPIATNDTEEGRAQNRRTEFKVVE